MPPLQFPLKGKHEGWARQAQPTLTTPDCDNVIPWDATQRGRGGTRPGLAKVWQYQFGTTNSRFIQHLSQADWLNASSASASFVIVVSGGNLYQCQVGTEPTGPVTGGSSIFSAGRRVEGAAYGGKVYLTDGIAYKELDLQTATCSGWTGSNAVSFPASNRLVLNWNGTLVLGLQEGNPERVYTARTGDPTDWDVGGVVAPDMPTASNVNWRMGQLGSPVTALISSIDQRLIIAQDHAIHVLVGHPSDGGILRAISEHTGILTPDAWTETQGAIYFLGNGDFYRLPLAGAPENLSAIPLHAPFDDLPNRGYWLNCEYDPINMGIWLFVVKDVDWSDPRHHFYDLRTGGFFPVSFPTAMAPVKSCLYDGRAETTVDRFVIVGCADGYVRKFSSTQYTDDGTAITSYAQIGPFGSLEVESLVNEIRVLPGQVPSGGTYNAIVSLQSGDSAWDALLNPNRTTNFNVTSGTTRSYFGIRQTGYDHFVRVYNSVSARIWSLEQIALGLERGKDD
jgi:hypothetical protein